MTPFARFGAVLIVVLLTAGCAALWIGVPAGAMWLAGELTDSFGWHMPLALAMIVPGMLLLAALLAWLNDLYLRVTGGRHVGSPEVPIRRRGPLETLLVVTLLLALTALTVWFFVFARNPGPGVI